LNLREMSKSLADNYLRIKSMTYDTGTLLGFLFKNIGRFLFLISIYIIELKTTNEILS